MAIGLQCFDANGTLTFTGTDRLSRFVGWFRVKSNIARNVPDIYGGEVFAFFSQTSRVSLWETMPSIIIQGRIIHVVYRDRTDEEFAFGKTFANIPGIIYYGVY